MVLLWMKRSQFAGGPYITAAVSSNLHGHSFSISFKQHIFPPFHPLHLPLLIHLDGEHSPLLNSLGECGKPADWILVFGEILSALMGSVTRFVAADQKKGKLFKYLLYQF